MLSIVLIFAARCLLVMLFLPFSALDKLLNTRASLAQTAQVVSARPLATALTIAAFGVEVLMSLAIVTGFADRLAALVLAAYCILTAIFWKPFWKAPDFALQGESRGRDLFWDFLKNLALAGGFLLLGLGPNAAGVARFAHDPLASSMPYRLDAVGESR